MEEINIKEFFNYILSKLYLIIIFVVLFALAGLLYFGYIQKPLYHSSTTVILVPESENTQATYNDVNLNKNLVSTYSQIAKNSSVLNKAIAKLNLKMTADQLASSISVSAVDDTEIIKIEVSNSDKYLAKDIAKEATNSFIDKVYEVYNLKNVTILSNASVAKAPYNIALPKQITLSALVGLFISFIIIFMFFYFDTTIKSTEDIEEKTGLIVLGSIPKVGEKDVK